MLVFSGVFCRRICVRNGLLAGKSIVREGLEANKRQSNIFQVNDAAEAFLFRKHYGSDRTANKSKAGKRKTQDAVARIDLTINRNETRFVA